MNRISLHAAPLRSFVIFGILLLLITNLFTRGQAANPARFNPASELLRRMKTYDTATNEEAFKLRFGLVHDYDAISANTFALTQLESDLRTYLLTLCRTLPPEIETELAQSERLIARKQAIIEEFKTANAVMINSRYYFPSVCEFVQKKYAPHLLASDVRSELDHLEHNVLLHNLSGEALTGTRALSSVQRIAKLKLPTSKVFQRDIRSLLLHATRLIQSQVRVEERLYALTAVPTVSSYDRITIALEQYRASQFKTAAYYQLALFLVCLLTLGYAIVAFAKIRRQSRELHQSNIMLETRVDERTHELNIANRELQQTEVHLRGVLDHAPIGIGSLSLAGTLLQTNAALCAILGRSESELLSTPFTQFLETSAQHHFAEQLRDLQASLQMPENRAELMESELQYQYPEGVLRWGRLALSLVTDEKGHPPFCILLLQDTTGQKEAEQHIERLAYNDVLTGLPNRALFMSRLKTALERAKGKERTVALLFIDCDNFKQINDTLGHDAGDEFLKQRAECMRESLRPTDTLARLGGDEFTILLENLPSLEMAIHIAKRVLARLAEPMQLMGHEVFGGASIGIALNESPGASAESMLREADTAMYQIKTASKGSYIVFEQHMNDRVNEQMQIESNLRRALDRNELCVYYQPLIDLETGRMVGAEALVRWIHPELGVVSPGKFIPVAETTGLILPIGYWVLEEACRQTKEWHIRWPQESPVSVSVNLSAQQLQRADIVDRIKAILDKIDFPPACLKLEVTESVMMQNMEDARQKLLELKSIGIKVALDDFGTGYSSMSNLVELPVDEIKIDRSFVSRLCEQSEASATVAAIITLAKAHGLHITGEGVETQDQLVQLQNYGCTVGQGYFFAKPLTAEALQDHFVEGTNSTFGKHSNTVNKEHIEHLLSQFMTHYDPDPRKAA